MALQQLKSGSGFLVFVVDDEVFMTRLIHLLLHRAGFQVRTFNQPTLALEALQTDPVKPHVLITDLMMPDMHGLELIRLCRALYPPIKTIVLSGSPIEIDWQNPANRDLVDEVLVKPVANEELVRSVLRLVLAQGFVAAAQEPMRNSKSHL